MFQILIVDDHEHLVESLARSIPWDQLQIDQVHKAYSGHEALDMLDTYPVEIVITDIRMPGMSGLELIERIRSKWKRMKCILLSGYAEFEYAKQAIQHHIADYILKPAEDEEIIASIRRVTELIRKEWEEVNSHQRTLTTLRENFPKLRDSLLNELLQGRRFSAPDLVQQLQSFEIPFAVGEDVTLMMVRMDESFSSFNHRDYYLMEYAIGNIAEEIYRDQYVLWRCKDSHDYLIFLIKEKEASKHSRDANEAYADHRQVNLEREAINLQNNIKAFLKGTVSILISDKGTFPDDLQKLYQSSLSFIRQRVGKNEQFLLSAGSFNEPPSIDMSTGLNDPPTLIQLLEVGRWEDVDRKLHDVFAAMNKFNAQTIQEHLMEVGFTVGSALISISHRNGKRLESVIGNDFESLFQSTPFRNVEQLQNWVFRVLQKVKNDMQSQQNETSTYLVRRAQEYVELHLAGNTSLQSVADYVFVHPVYLSRVYKSETGEGLSAYILRLKMEKSEKMLLESSMKIHQIAEALGYDNPPYFIKVFKKHFGLTPKEYRDQMPH